MTYEINEQLSDILPEILSKKGFTYAGPIRLIETPDIAFQFEGMIKGFPAIVRLENLFDKNREVNYFINVFSDVTKAAMNRFVKSELGITELLLK